MKSSSSGLIPYLISSDTKTDYHYPFVLSSINKFIGNVTLHLHIIPLD